jgi:integrase/recombinase XerD
MDIESGAVTIHTLKRRRPGVVRQVPLPTVMLKELDHFFGLADAHRDARRARQPIWRWGRTTAWRRIKEVMAAAGISGTPAMPKRLAA